jgi:hypothetical protein
MGDGRQAQGGQSPAQAPARPPAYMDAAAGALAGVVARFVVQPLDVLKIRFQVQVEPIQRGASAAAASKYTGLRQALSAIVREEGIRARPCSPTSTEGGQALPLVCAVTESTPGAPPKRSRPAPPRSRAGVRPRCPALRGVTHPPRSTAAARRAPHREGAVARAHAPVRRGLHALLPGRGGARRDNPCGRAAELCGRARAVQPAARRRRRRRSRARARPRPGGRGAAQGLWRGTLPGQLLTVPYTAVQFVALQHCRAAAARHGLLRGDGAPALSFLCGAAAGAAATIASYPFDLLRTTLAAQGEPRVRRPRQGLLGCCKVAQRCGEQPPVAVRAVYCVRKWNVPSPCVWAGLRRAVQA